jgi:outer membrane protein TolC
MRAADSGLVASNLALRDIREQVEEDAVITYLALDQDQRKRDALAQQSAFAARLRDIVQDRLDSGLDSAMELTRAKRTVVSLRLQVLQLDDEIASYTDHLARLVGLPGNPIATIPDSIPSVDAHLSAPPSADPFAVQSAFAEARSRQQQAFGDSRYTLRPQIAFGVQYSRFSTYNNNYATYYPGIQSQPNAIGAALDISLPFLDAGRKAKARESLAAASHAQHQAIFAQEQALEGRLKLEHSTAELAARAELASLDRDYAQQQLDAVLVQLEAASNGGAPAINPRDEQNARIQERQRFIEMIDADSLLRQNRVSLLRQSGLLEEWLRTALVLSPKP